MPPQILAPLPEASAMLIQSLAPMIIIGGFLVVLAALGPVRRAFSAMADRMERPHTHANSEPEVKVKTELDRFDIDTIYTD